METIEKFKAFLAQVFGTQVIYKRQGEVIDTYHWRGRIYVITHFYLKEDVQTIGRRLVDRRNRLSRMEDVNAPDSLISRQKELIHRAEEQFKRATA